MADAKDDGADDGPAWEVTRRKRVATKATARAAAMPSAGLTPRTPRHTAPVTPHRTPVHAAARTPALSTPGRASPRSQSRRRGESSTGPTAAEVFLTELRTAALPAASTSGLRVAKGVEVSAAARRRTREMRRMADVSFDLVAPRDGGRVVPADVARAATMLMHAALADVSPTSLGMPALQSAALSALAAVAMAAIDVLDMQAPAAATTAAYSVPPMAAGGLPPPAVKDVEPSSAPRALSFDEPPPPDSERRPRTSSLPLAMSFGSHAAASDGGAVRSSAAASTVDGIGPLLPAGAAAGDDDDEARREAVDNAAGDVAQLFLAGVWGVMRTRTSQFGWGVVAAAADALNAALASPAFVKAALALPVDAIPDRMPVAAGRLDIAELALAAATGAKGVRAESDRANARFVAAEAKAALTGEHTATMLAALSGHVDDDVDATRRSPPPPSPDGAARDVAHMGDVDGAADDQERALAAALVTAAAAIGEHFGAAAHASALRAVERIADVRLAPGALADVLRPLRCRWATAGSAFGWWVSPAMASPALALLEAEGVVKATRSVPSHAITVRSGSFAGVGGVDDHASSSAATSVAGGPSPVRGYEVGGGGNTRHTSRRAPLEGIPLPASVCSRGQTVLVARVALAVLSAAAKPAVDRGMRLLSAVLPTLVTLSSSKAVGGPPGREWAAVSGAGSSFLAAAASSSFATPTRQGGPRDRSASAVSALQSPATHLTRTRSMTVSSAAPGKSGHSRTAWVADVSEVGLSLLPVDCFEVLAARLVHSPSAVHLLSKLLARHAITDQAKSTSASAPLPPGLHRLLLALVPLCALHDPAGRLEGLARDVASTPSVFPPPMVQAMVGRMAAVELAMRDAREAPPGRGGAHGEDDADTAFDGPHTFAFLRCVARSWSSSQGSIVGAPLASAGAGGAAGSIHAQLLSSNIFATLLFARGVLVEPARPAVVGLDGAVLQISAPERIAMRPVGMSFAPELAMFEEIVRRSPATSFPTCTEAANAVLQLAVSEADRIATIAAMPAERLRRDKISCDPDRARERVIEALEAIGAHFASTPAATAYLRVLRRSAEGSSLEAFASLAGRTPYGESATVDAGAMVQAMFASRGGSGGGAAGAPSSPTITAAGGASEDSRPSSPSMTPLMAATPSGRGQQPRTSRRVQHPPSAKATAAAAKSRNKQAPLQAEIAAFREASAMARSDAAVAAMAMEGDGDADSDAAAAAVASPERDATGYAAMLKHVAVRCVAARHHHELGAHDDDEDYASVDDWPSLRLEICVPSAVPTAVSLAILAPDPRRGRDSDSGGVAGGVCGVIHVPAPTRLPEAVGSTMLDQRAARIVSASLQLSTGWLTSAVFTEGIETSDQATAAAMPVCQLGAQASICLPPEGRAVARGAADSIAASAAGRCILHVPFNLLLTKLPTAEAAAAVSLVGTEFATTRVNVDEACGAAIVKHLAPFDVSGGVAGEESLVGHPAVFAFAFAGTERAVVRLGLAGVDDSDDDKDDDACDDADDPWLDIGAAAVAACARSRKGQGDGASAAAAPAAAVDVTMAAGSVTLLVLLERYLEWLQVASDSV